MLIKRLNLLNVSHRISFKHDIAHNASWLCHDKTPPSFVKILFLIRKHNYEIGNNPNIIK